MLLKSGYLAGFIELAEDLIPRVPTTLSPFFTSELQFFLQTNLALSYSLIGKKFQANKLISALDELVKTGASATQRFSNSGLKAVVKMQLNQHAEALKQINMNEKDSHEKDVIRALAQYAQQEYKEYYLSCIKLVTQLKQERFLQQASPAEADANTYLLGYAYYLKARAEHTFLEARKQGIRLKEDFSDQESKMFTADYFKTKAARSCDKSKRALAAWPELIPVLDELSKKL